MGSEREAADGDRRQAYLRCVCAALNFDVGEIWSWRTDDSTFDDDGILGREGGSGRVGPGGRTAGSMRFIQLYTSPSFRSQRSKLVTPSEDWEQSEKDVSKHRFSPVICDAVREGGEIVWANTAVREGLLGRSDLPLRTAVGAPVCSLGPDLCVLILFSPYIVQNSTGALEFLYTLSKAASDATQVFLPASTSAHVRPVHFPARWYRDTNRRGQRLDAIRASLPGVIFETLAMGQQSSHPEHAIRGALHRSSHEHAGTIPSEYFWPTAGGSAYANSVYGSTSADASGGGTMVGGGILTERRNSSADALGSSGAGGALLSSARDVGMAKAGQAVAAAAAGVGLSPGGGGSGAGSVATGQPISPMDRSLNRSSRSLSPLALGGGASGVGARVAAATAQPSRPHRRGSGTSAASSVEWGSLANGLDEVVVDSDEYYNLWAAFMEPDSPPGSPSHSDSGSPLGAEHHDEEDVKENDGTGSLEKDEQEGADGDDLSTYRSLSELLSGGAGGAGGDDDDDDMDVQLSSAVQQQQQQQQQPNSQLPPAAVKKEELDKDNWGQTDTVDSGSVGTTVGMSGSDSFSASDVNAFAPPRSPMPPPSVSAMGGGGGVGVEDAGTMTAGALRAAQNAAAAERAAAIERRGFTGDALKRARFNEFISGFLSVSVFHAADVWLPLERQGGGSGDGGDETSRLFLFSSSVQDLRLAKWSNLSRNVVLASGVGVPGLVFQERRSQWAVDYSQVDAGRNPLASVARLLGIGSAFGVPLPLGSQECGVVMLYSTSCLAPSELMVEFVERATGLLLADVPAPNSLRQQIRDKQPSAEDIGRVAGAYQHHAMWAGQQQRSREARDVNSSSPTEPGSSWGGAGTALAVAAAAAAGGGQGGGFRADGGAVAFVPPHDWPAGDTPAPPLIFNRVDLDGHRSSSEDLESVSDHGSITPKIELGGHEQQQQQHSPQKRQQQRQPGAMNSTGSQRSSPGSYLSAGYAAAAAAAKSKARVNSAPEGTTAAAAALAAEQAANEAVLAERAATLAASKARAAAAAAGAVAVAEREAAVSGQRSRVSVTVGGGDGGGRAGAGGGGGAGAVVGGMVHENVEPPSSKCRAQGCENRPTGRTSFCWEHWSAARQCQNPGCDKLSQGNTRLCIAHGGGRRCTHPGCNKGARDRFFCAAHGGGKRCSVHGCGKAAVGGSDLCTGHGGGKRCQYPDCPKSAQSKTNFCVRHGGGRKCSIQGCLKVARGRTSHCAAHGGGVRCCIDACNKAAVGRERMCRSHQRKSKAAAGGGGAGQSSHSSGSPASAFGRRGAGAGAAPVSRAPSFPTALSALSAAAVAHAATDLLDLGGQATAASTGSRGGMPRGGSRKRGAGAIAGGDDAILAGAGNAQRYRSVTSTSGFAPP